MEQLDIVAWGRQRSNGVEQNRRQDGPAGNEFTLHFEFARSDVEFNPLDIHSKALASSTSEAANIEVGGKSACFFNSCMPAARFLVSGCDIELFNNAEEVRACALAV